MGIRARVRLGARRHLQDEGGSLLVKGLGFKPCAGQRELSWVSSILTRPRHFLR